MPLADTTATAVDTATGAVSWWLVVLVAVGAGAAGLVTALFGGVKRVAEAVFDRLVKRLKDGRGGYGPIETLTLLAEFNTVLVEARKVPSVGRVLLFVGHNGGGLPVAGKPYTVRSQTGWSIRQGDGDQFRSYAFDIEVDDEYCAMVIEAHKKTVVAMTTADMKTGLLRSIYEAEGVVAALLYTIHLDTERNQFSYITVASYEREFTTAERAMVDILVYRLRALLKSEPN